MYHTPPRWCSKLLQCIVLCVQHVTRLIGQQSGKQNAQCGRDNNEVTWGAGLKLQAAHCIMTGVVAGYDRTQQKGTQATRHIPTELLLL